MSNFVVANLSATGNAEVYVNLDQVAYATPSPQVMGGPNTLHMADGTTTFVIVQRIQDLAGFN